MLAPALAIEASTATRVGPIGLAFFSSPTLSLVFSSHLSPLGTVTESPCFESKAGKSIKISVLQNHCLPKAGASDLRKGNDTDNCLKQITLHSVPKTSEKCLTEFNLYCI